MRIYDIVLYYFPSSIVHTAAACCCWESAGRRRRSTRVKWVWLSGVIKARLLASVPLQHSGFLPSLLFISAAQSREQKTRGLGGSTSLRALGAAAGRLRWREDSDIGCERVDWEEDYFRGSYRSTLIIFCVLLRSGWLVLYLLNSVDNTVQL